jgi:hypothetical protein
MVIARMRKDSSPVRDTRIAATQAVTLLLGEIEVPAVVKDVSRSGVRLECAERLEVGERFRINMGRHGDLLAEVRWASAGEVGALFLTPSFDP